MNPDRHAVLAHRLFDGDAMREEMAVVIEGPRIVAVIPHSELPPSMPRRELSTGLLLAPGFVDLQVNGGGDVLFNNDPTPEGIRSIVAAHRKFGTTALLPTFISDEPSKMAAAIAAAESLIETEPSVLGIHLEGPFVSPDKAGVHDVGALRQPTSDDLAIITAPRRGITLVTLAPECVPARFLETLVAAGVRVSLGHSMASYQQTCTAISQGVTGFTHLFNAMRPLETREPGPIAAALESSCVWYGLIVDNVHVAPAMLRLALRGRGRPFLVTDAMPPVGGSSPVFKLAGRTITVHDGRCTAPDGKLAGAYLDMASAVRNCVRELDVPLADALRFASTHPAQFIGLGDTLGRLAPGFRADLVAIDEAKIGVAETWVAGASSNSAELC